MRPAMYLRKGGRLSVVSMAPTMFGVMRSGNDVVIAGWGAKPEPIEGSLADALREQFEAMNEKEDCDTKYSVVTYRLMHLVRNEAVRILKNAYDGFGTPTDEKVAMIWPTGGVKYVDASKVEDGSPIIDGVNIKEEGVMVYRLEDLKYYENRVEEFSLNLIELL